MKKGFFILLAIINLNLCLFAQQHGNRGGCYNTTWPLDMANSNRSNTVTNCGFTSNFDTNQVNYSNISLPFPVFSYSRDSNEVFVIGGCPLILYNYGAAIETGIASSPSSSYNSLFDPYIARLNTDSMTAQILTLSGGNAAPYIGGAVIHANGFIYTIAAGRLFKLQSNPFQEVTAVNLPSSGLAQLNFYNGLAVSRSGRIIAKTYNQVSGQGYFFLLDENNLNIIYQLSLSMASPRLTVDVNNNREYIYHLNQTETYRIEIRNDSLIPDNTWTAAYDPYNDNSTDEPTSPVIANGKVFYTTNTLYSATRAMKIFWQNKGLSFNSNVDTLGGFYLHSDTTISGWSFFHLSVDDTISGIIIGNDQGSGKICAGIIDSNNNYQVLWERNLKTSARPVIVADRNLVYVNDFVNGYDYLVVLDLLSGQEKGRIKTDATKPTIGTIIITPDDNIIYASNEYGSNNGFVNIFKQSQISTEINRVVDIEAKIFPNPVNENLSIICQESNFDINIFDQSGILVYQKTGVSNLKNIDLSALPAGLYNITIQTESGFTTKKFVKN
jgi:hypothetical protein